MAREYVIFRMISGIFKLTFVDRHEELHQRLSEVSSSALRTLLFFRTDSAASRHPSSVFT